MGGNLLEYSRNALLSIGHFMKFIPRETRNAHLRLPEQLWVNWHLTTSKSAYVDNEEEIT